MYANDPRISLVEPGRDIFEVLSCTDVILSNGSNVILEGLIQGIPSISIINWMHPSGPHGRDLSQVVMNLEGCLDSESSQILPSLILALSEEFVDETKIASSRLLPHSLRGRGAGLSANLIEHFYAKRINVDSHGCELIAERDSAIAERHSIVNSTIWKSTSPYRKAKRVFRKN